MAVASGMTYWDALLPSIVLGLLAVGILPWLNRGNTRARTVAIGVCIFLAWRYMLWRITETLPPADQTLDFAVGAVFTLVEMLSMLGATLALVFLTRTKDRTPEADTDVVWLKSQPEQPLVGLPGYRATEDLGQCAVDARSRGGAGVANLFGALVGITEKLRGGE